MGSWADSNHKPMHRKSALKSALTGLSVALFAAFARADENAANLAALKSMSLEDLGEIKVNIVVTASKYEQKTTEAPSSVSVVTQEEIKLNGYRTLADILGSLQGFSVTYDRNNAYVGVRGLSLGDFNSRVLLLIDGHRMNNNLTDSADIGNEFLLDADLIDRVEVIRGPGSVLYGNNAFFAVINVITRKGGQVNGVEASGEYGEFDTFKFRVTAGKAFTNGVSLLLSGSYYNSEGADLLGYNLPPGLALNPGNQTGQQVSTNMDGENYGQFFASIGYGEFALEGGYDRREKVDPTAYNFTTFDDPRARAVAERSYADLKFTHEFPDIADLTARVYYDRYDTKTGYPLYAAPAPTFFYQEVESGEWWGAELQLNKKLWQKHQLSVGAEYRDDFQQNDQLFDENGNPFGSGLHATRQSYGVFAEGDFVLRDDLHFNAGARYDQVGDFDPAVSQRLGLIYRPFEKSTIKALYGTAFRAPNFQEIIYSYYTLKNPETIDSYELVYEQGIGEHLRSSVSGFYNRLNNLIVFENGLYENLNAETRGMELALEGTWAKGVRARASYTLQRTDNITDGGSFPDSPEHMVKLNVSVPVFKENLFASLEVQYVSSRHTVYTDPNVGHNGSLNFPGADTDGFPTVNFTLFSKDIVKNWEVSASVYNLLGENYADPATRFHLQDQIPQNGRTFRLKMTYRF
jgi:outer membrane receptor for ferrienterochelin and colicins